jgi:hypothetical protein
MVAEAIALDVLHVKVLYVNCPVQGFAIVTIIILA